MTNREPADGDRLMGTAEIARRFDVRRETVARWLKAGRFPDAPGGDPGVIRTPSGTRGVYRVRASVVRGLLDGTLAWREATDGDE
jgi:predicted site-specific integrase-resolvase